MAHEIGPKSINLCFQLGRIANRSLASGSQKTPKYRSQNSQIRSVFLNVLTEIIIAMSGFGGDNGDGNGAEDGFVVRVRGLPWSATTEEIANFFDESDIKGGQARRRSTSYRNSSPELSPWAMGP